jgi:hypothetical protein
MADLTVRIRMRVYYADKHSDPVDSFAPLRS